MKDQEQNGTYDLARDMILPLLVFLVGIVVLGLLGYHFRENQNSLQQSRVELNATTYAEHMRLDIMQGISATNTLEQILVSNDGEIRKFPQIARSMMDDFIQSIQLAPGGTVTDIYPAEGNEAGKIDLLHDEERGEICRYGRDHHVITMQGPFSLKQGGMGIAVRNPVFLEGADGRQEFWGFTIVIIRVPEIFSESLRALSDFGYDYRLSKNRAPWDERYVEVYGSGTEMEQAVTYQFEVGDTRWLLEVQPKDGWSGSWNYHLILACGVLILLLLSGLLSVFTLLRRTKKSELRTAELNRRLQEALDMANAASVAKTKFINNMSHDIRTPLNGIIGLLKINELHADDAALVQANYEKMRVSADHLLSLINDVLEVSRLEDGTTQPAPAPLDLVQLSQEVGDIISERTAEAGLTVSFEPQEMPVRYVYGSALHLRQIFLNVYGNCIKYNRAGGTIRTALACVDRDARTVTYRWTISDTGIGMSEEFLRHIFEPFTQENNDARSVYHGTGLGMSIVKGLLEQMHGTISVTSREGEGSTFIITIPFAIAEKPAAEEGKAAGDVRGLRLLLAEDNTLNAEIARTLLTDKGAVVTTVDNGQQALALFQKEPAGTFDAILMDVMMPVMDGLTAARAIRALDRPDAKTIPIIAMTASAFAEDAQRCFDAGMNAHLAKPLELDRMLSVIAALCADRS